MTLQAYPVKLEDGVVRSIDGSPLPERAYAVLVILPELSGPIAPEDWQRSFHAFFATVRSHPAATDLASVSDTELNQLVHAARKPA